VRIGIVVVLIHIDDYEQNVGFNCLRATSSKSFKCVRRVLGEKSLPVNCEPISKGNRPNRKYRNKYETYILKKMQTVVEDVQPPTDS